MAHLYPSKIEWDRIPTDPVQGSCETELLDTQVFSGSVKRGSCGSDFLDCTFGFLSVAVIEYLKIEVG